MAALLSRVQYFSGESDRRRRRCGVARWVLLLHLLLMSLMRPLNVVTRCRPFLASSHGWLEAYVLASTTPLPAGGAFRNVVRGDGGHVGCIACLKGKTLLTCAPEHVCAGRHAHAAGAQLRTRCCHGRDRLCSDSERAGVLGVLGLHSPVRTCSAAAALARRCGLGRLWEVACT